MQPITQIVTGDIYHTYSNVCSPDTLKSASNRNLTAFSNLYTSRAVSDKLLTGDTYGLS